MQKHRFNGLVGVYTKPQLKKLCEAYGVPNISRLNKTNLAQRLASVIQSNNGFIVPSVVDSRQYAVVNSEMDPSSGRICLRLATVSATQAMHSAESGKNKKHKVNMLRLVITLKLFWLTKMIICSSPSVFARHRERLIHYTFFTF